MEARRTALFLGGRMRPGNADMPPAAPSPFAGYIVYIDMAAVGAVAIEHGVRIDLAQLSGVADAHDYDQDSRFGIIVLSEVASRALPASVNDPGTAIDVIGRITRLLTLWSQGPEPSDTEEVEFPRVHVPPLPDEDLFADDFAPIARDGAALIEVQTRLHKALGALAGMGGPSFRAAALLQLRLANLRTVKALTLEVEKESLQRPPGSDAQPADGMAGALQGSARNDA